jgi:hypothetical protein
MSKTAPWFSASVGFRGKIQNLIDSLLECNQAPVNEFIARTGEFVGVANIENFPQALLGIKAHTVAVGNGNEHEIQQFFQSRESTIESFSQESMIDPTERTANGPDAIRPRRLASDVDWHGKAPLFPLHRLSSIRKRRSGGSLTMKFEKAATLTALHGDLGNPHRPQTMQKTRRELAG